MKEIKAEISNNGKVYTAIYTDEILYDLMQDDHINWIIDNTTGELLYLKNI